MHEKMDPSWTHCWPNQSWGHPFQFWKVSWYRSGKGDSCLTGFWVNFFNINWHWRWSLWVCDMVRLWFFSWTQEDLSFDFSLQKTDTLETNGILHWGSNWRFSSRCDKRDDKGKQDQREPSIIERQNRVQFKRQRETATILPYILILILW